MTDRPKPDPNAEWWTTTDVAAYLGVELRTVSSYRSRGQMPTPDDRIGQSWIWKPARIIEWRPNEHGQRRGPGEATAHDGGDGPPSSA